MEFPVTKFLWTYLFIDVARGGVQNRPSPNWNVTNDKIITTKRYVFSVLVSLSIFAYNSIRLQQTNINDQVGGLGPPNQIFAIQFKCITRIYDKTKISQGKYSIDSLLLKILQEAMYFASSTWTKSITKFNPKIQDFKRVLTWSVSKGKTHQFDCFNWLLILKNLVILNASKNVQNVIQMALK